jgi:hypothetical protein
MMSDQYGQLGRSLDEDFGPDRPGGWRPAPGYVLCPIEWLARVRSVVRTSDRLLVALVLYRQCLLKRSWAVTLPNRDLVEMGISRRTKFRALAALAEAGVVSMRQQNGCVVEVTLNWHP